MDKKPHIVDELLAAGAHPSACTLCDAGLRPVYFDMPGWERTWVHHSGSGDGKVHLCLPMSLRERDAPSATPDL